MAENKNYMFPCTLTPSELQLPLCRTVQDCSPLALSGSACMPACFHVCRRLYIKSIPAFSVFFLRDSSMNENVSILKGFSAKCPNSHGSYFEHEQGDLSARFQLFSNKALINPLINATRPAPNCGQAASEEQRTTFR